MRNYNQYKIINNQYAFNTIKKIFTILVLAFLPNLKFFLAVFSESFKFYFTDTVLLKANQKLLKQIRKFKNKSILLIKISLKAFEVI